MKKVLSERKGVLKIVCDNLKEYFAEFVKCRNSLRSTNEWDEYFNKFYGKGTFAFKENERNNIIVEFLMKNNKKLKKH